MSKTRTERLVERLETGKEITAEQIERKFGINPYHAIYRLRDEGHTIYTNHYKDGAKYRMG